jgi:thioredoxin reductase
MQEKNRFDVIIVGGSYAGLSAAMTLGRSLRKVLVIDSGKPCNRFTTHSHNFITHDGAVPSDIYKQAKKQVTQYETVSFFDGTALKATRHSEGFNVTTDNDNTFKASKLIFASGLRDVLPDVAGLRDCWGKTLLHCPYCHGYEVRNKKTGILGNGEYAFEFSKMILNWTSHLSIFTNGASTLTEEQREKIKKHNIPINEKKISRVEHNLGIMSKVVFEDNSSESLDAVYIKPHVEQHCDIPVSLGCEQTETGHLKVDGAQKTTVPGVYACGDNSHLMRTVSLAVAAGTLAGAMANKELVDETF